MAVSLLKKATVCLPEFYQRCGLTSTMSRAFSEKGMMLGTEISSGSFAKVHYLAAGRLDLVTKIPREERLESCRFTLEGELMAQLNKEGVPHVPVLYDRGKLQERYPYIAMFRIPQPDLFTVSRTAPLQTEALISIALQTLEMLHALSLQGIVHTDLKPENMILCSGQLTVIDFGLSYVVGTTQSTAIQTRFYRAPEVILDEPHGCSVDMWSLGCLLFELYTGTVLFNVKGRRNDPIANTQHLQMIVDQIGGLPFSSVTQSPLFEKHPFTKEWGWFYRQIDILPSAPWRSLMGKAGARRKDAPEIIRHLTSLIEGMLRYKNARVLPSEALKNPLFDAKITVKVHHENFPQDLEKFESRFSLNFYDPVDENKPIFSILMGLGSFCIHPPRLASFEYLISWAPVGEPPPPPQPIKLDSLAEIEVQWEEGKPISVRRRPSRHTEE